MLCFGVDSWIKKIFWRKCFGTKYVEKLAKANTALARVGHSVN